MIVSYTVGKMMEAEDLKLAEKIRKVLECQHLPTIRVEIKKIIKELNPKYDMVTDSYKRE